MAKLYVIYKIRPFKDAELYPIPKLYAWTVKKKILNQFKEERDMTQFVVKSKPIDGENSSQQWKIEKFCLENNQTQLEIRSMYTKDKIYSQKKSIVNVLCTWNELQWVYTHGDGIYEELGRFVTDKYLCLQDNLKEALDKIGYREARDFQLAKLSGMYFESVNKSEEVDIDVDEFGMFLYAFGSTFK